MKIGFISDTLYPYFKGGIETVRYTEMCELAPVHEVYSFSMRFDGMKENFKKDGINFVSFGKTDQRYFYNHGRRSIRNALKYTVLLPFYLFRYDFDVVQVNAFPYLHLPAVKLYCMMKNCKMVIASYEVWSPPYWKEYLGSLGFLAPVVNSFEKWCLGFGDFYTAISTATLSKLEALGIPRHKTEVFSPTIDTSQLRGIAAGSKRKKQVMFAGRLIKEKRLDLWVHVLKGVAAKAREAEGLIVGEGPEEGSIREAIRRSGLSGRVKLRHFYKDKASLYREMKNSSVLLNMSEREGLSVIALESIAVGTPVVLPSYSPIPEEVKSMCTVAETDKLPGIIAQIFRDGPQPMSDETRERLKMFSASATRNVYEGIFKRLKLD